MLLHSVRLLNLLQGMHMFPTRDTIPAYEVGCPRKCVTLLLIKDYSTDWALILATLDESVTYSVPRNVGSLLRRDIQSNLKGDTHVNVSTH